MVRVEFYLMEAATASFMSWDPVELSSPVLQDYGKKTATQKASPKKATIPRWGPPAVLEYELLGSSEQLSECIFLF